MVLVEVELGLSVLLALAFVLELGRPWLRGDVVMAWMQALLGWSVLFVDMVLLVVLLGAPVWPWAFAVALIGQDAVFAWRLWLVLAARRR